MKVYKKFLKKIGYLKKSSSNFKIMTKNVDNEISSICGPQLVCPISNARFILNAANARWVSLYDSLYGTDVIPETNGAVRGKTYNPIRGKKVIEYARNLLDKYVVYIFHKLFIRFHLFYNIFHMSNFITIFHFHN